MPFPPLLDLSSPEESGKIEHSINLRIHDSAGQDDGEARGGCLLGAASSQLHEM
jgi:hypothetical protein